MKKLIWLSIALTLLSPSPGWAEGGFLEFLEKRANYFGKTQEKTEVQVILDKGGRLDCSWFPVLFSVPKAYLITKNLWDGGSSDRLSMEAYLPNMEPLSLIENPDYRQEVFVELITGKGKGRGYLRQDSIKKDLARKWFFADGGESVVSMPHYRDRVKDSTNDYYIPQKTYDGKLRLIDCASKKFSKGRCTVKTDYDENIGLNYSIARSELPRWEQIDKKVREFVKGLIVEPIDTVCQEKRCTLFHGKQAVGSIHHDCVGTKNQKAGKN